MDTNEIKVRFMIPVDGIVRLDADSNQWIGECPILDASSVGDTEEEARANLQRNLAMRFEEESAFAPGRKQARKSFAEAMARV